MTNLSTFTTLWYAMVFMTILVYPTIVVCQSRVTKMQVFRLAAWQGLTLYIGYLLNIITLPGI